VRLSSPKRSATKKTKIQIYIPEKYYAHIKKEADTHGITVSELVRSIIRTHYGSEIESE
jgi:predicted DNA binding CopG/RHH family protein